MCVTYMSAREYVTRTVYLHVLGDESACRSYGEGVERGELTPPPPLKNAILDERQLSSTRVFKYHKFPESNG